MMLKKNETEFRDFWRAAAEASRIVAEWPIWKRGYMTTRADKLAKAQRELAALEYLIRECQEQGFWFGLGAPGGFLAWVSKDGMASTHYKTYTDAAVALGWKMEMPA